MTVDSHDPDERFESVNIDEDDYDATSFDLEKSWKFFDPDYDHEQSEEQDFEIIREIRIGYRLYGFDIGVNIRADH